jgi:predicted  nucleic acid-binding Zn-ribbon protein
MTFKNPIQKICIRCGIEYDTWSSQAKYCPKCRAEVQLQMVRDYNKAHSKPDGRVPIKRNRPRPKSEIEVEEARVRAAVCEMVLCNIGLTQKYVRSIVKEKGLINSLASGRA